jgi:hypothetical protein
MAPLTHAVDVCRAGLSGGRAAYGVPVRAENKSLEDP